MHHRHRPLAHRHNSRPIALLLALILLFSLIGTAFANEETDQPNPTNPADTSDYPTTSQAAYEALIAYKNQAGYQEGTKWDNYEPYGTKGTLGSSYRCNSPVRLENNRLLTGGVGCAAFAFKLSDNVFGNLPSRVYYGGQFTYEDIKVGDHLRIYGGSHSVIVLQVTPAGCIVAEANYNKSVHWGRVISKTEVMAASYVVTRWPADLPSDDGTGDEVRPENKGNTSTGQTWQMTNSGILTISGAGALPDYDNTSNPAPWASLEYNTAVISDGITSIGSYAFSGKTSLTKVVIPGTVTTIGRSAFQNCSNLISLSIPEGVQEIGQEAFSGCAGLTILDLPGSIIRIGDAAFANCTQLLKIVFANNKTGAKLELGNSAFLKCWYLQIVILPSNITKIGNGMFASTQLLTTLYIPSSVEKIEMNAFASSGITKIYFEGDKSDWERIAEANLNLLGLTNIGIDPNSPNPQSNLNQAIANGEIVLNTPFINPFDNDGSDIITDTPDSDHQHSWSTAWASDDTHHWHDCEVPYCPIADNSEKDSYTTHDWSNHDGICKICKAACRHQMNAATSTCDICQFTCSHKMNATTNTCEVCGFTCPEHQWSAETGSCQICHLQCSHQYENSNPICTICHAEHRHTSTSMLKYDATGHWRPCGASNCPDTSFKSQFEPHNYFVNKPKCDTCGYVHQHTWSSGDNYGKDSDKHWRICTDPTCPFDDDHPDAQDQVIYHEYEPDGTCICGATKPADAPSHTWSENWSHDGDSHWKICTDPDCDARNYRASHTYDQPEDKCICGAINPTEITPPCDHVDEDQNNLCDKCGEAMPHQENFASHSKTDFDTTGVCQHEGCSYTLTQFQHDCTVDHSTISVNSTCTTCGAPGTKTDSTDPGSKPTTPSNPDPKPTTPSTPDTPSTPTYPSYPYYPSYPSYPSTPSKPSQPTTANKVETITQPDGSKVTLTTQPSGTIIVTTGKTQPTSVTIPSTSVTSHTVVAIVKPDGSSEIIKACVPTTNGLKASLPDGATVKIIDNYKSFADVSANDWSEPAITFVTARELFSGTSPTTFSPDTPMTRAMLMTVLARLDGINTSTGATWYERGLNWAIQRGISDGSNPSGNITREQLVVMLWRYLGSPNATGSLHGYTDANQINTYATDAVCWAIGHNIMNGHGDGRLDPQGNATRAEVAQFLQNLITALPLDAT